MVWTDTLQGLRLHMASTKANATGALSVVFQAKRSSGAATQVIRVPYLGGSHVVHNNSCGCCGSSVLMHASDAQNGDGHD